MAIDPNIKKKADDIRNKIYGKEVRESLASGLEAMSTDVVENTGRQDNVESRFQDVIENTTDKDVISAPEIIAARDGETNLKARLDKEHQKVTAQLAHKVGGGKRATLDDLGTEVLSAIEGGEGTNFNLLSNPNRGSVYPQTTTFLEVGKNLFDKSAITMDYYLDRWGEVQIIEKYFTTDFMPVEPGMVINRNKSGTFVLFDKNKEFLAGYGSTDQIVTFLVPENCYYIRSSHVRTQLDDMQVQIGEPTEYEPYEVRVHDSIKVDTKNLNTGLHDDVYNGVLHSNAFSEVKNDLRKSILHNGESALLYSTNAPAKLRIVVKEKDIDFIKIVAQGKNLFNGKTVDGFIDFTVTDEVLRFSSSNPVGTTEWFRVLPNMPISITGGNRSFWQFKNKESTSYTVIKGETATVTTPEDAYYGRVYYKNNITEYIEDEVQVELGLPSEYESHRKYEFMLNDLNRGDILFQDEFLKWYKGDLSNPIGGMGLLHLFNDTLVSVESNSTDIEACRVEIDYGYDVGTTEATTGVYGVRFNTETPDTTAERIYDSVGLNSNYSIGTQMVYPRENDFDKIYPWSEMKLCNINTLDGNKVLTYEGESGFSRTGSNGDVFVEIPRFYSREFVKDGWKHVLISGKETDGITLDPVFLDGDKELEKIYVGVYEADINENKLMSRSNTYPKTEEKPDDYEFFAKQKGVGYGEFDWRVVLALQKLFIVEHATRNSSSMMEGYTYVPYWGDRRKAMTTIAQSNHIFVTLSSDNNQNGFFVGENVGVGHTQEINNRKVTAVEFLEDLGQVKITFDGSPIDITADLTQIYGIPQKTGDADGIPYHTGRLANRNSNLSPMKYRHIENLWGNTWTVVSGLYMQNLEYLFVEDSEKYNHLNLEDYKKLAYKAPLQNQYPSSNQGFIKKMGVDHYHNLSFPSEVIPNSPGTYYTDGFYSYDELDKIYSPVFGGGWDHPWSGMYNIRFWTTPDNGNWLYGGRLIYRKYKN